MSKYCLGQVVNSKELKTWFDSNGDWIELNDGANSCAALIVWRMEDETRSPEREAFAKRIVDSLNSFKDEHV